jgi:hypothetical protein
MDEWVWSIGGMILTDENWNTRRKTCPSANLSTTNLWRTGLGSNLGLRDDRPVTNRFSHGTASTYVLDVTNIYKLSSYFTANTKSAHKNYVPVNAG